MATFTCKQCGRSREGWARLCEFCATPTLFEAGSDELQTVCVPDVVGVVRIGDIEIPEAHQRFRTPFENLNEALKGGFAFPSNVQIAGPPGSGKSTLTLQFLDKHAKRSMFVAVEETEADVARRCKRLRMRRATDIGLLCNVTNPEHIQAKIIEQAPDIVVIDSVTKLRWSPHDYEGPALEAEIVSEMCQFAKKQHAHANRQGHPFLLILISHVLKSGELAGRKSVEHDVDMTLKMRMNPADGDDGEIRINQKPLTAEEKTQRETYLKLRTVQCKKTRSGGAPTFEPTFLLEEDGLHEYPPR